MPELSLTPLPAPFGMEVGGIDLARDIRGRYAACPGSGLRRAQGSPSAVSGPFPRCLCRFRPGLGDTARRRLRGAKRSRVRLHVHGGQRGRGERAGGLPQRRLLLAHRLRGRGGPRRDGPCCTACRRRKKEGRRSSRDMQAAYEALDEATRRKIDPLVAVHRYSGTGRSSAAGEEWEHPLQPVTEETADRLPPPARRPLARAHSVTGRKGLYSPAGSIVAVEGMEREEAHRLVRRLKIHAILPEFRYAHRYRPGDLLMWDNTATIHFARPIGLHDGGRNRRLPAPHRTPGTAAAVVGFRVGVHRVDLSLRSLSDRGGALHAGRSCASNAIWTVSRGFP